MLYLTSNPQLGEQIVDLSIDQNYRLSIINYLNTGPIQKYTLVDFKKWSLNQHSSPIHKSSIEHGCLHDFITMDLYANPTWKSYKNSALLIHW